VVIVRSILFNVLFYLNLVVLLFVALATLAMPRRAVLKMAELWGRISVWLLRVVCGTKFEVRGLDRAGQAYALLWGVRERVLDRQFRLPVRVDRRRRVRFYKWNLGWLTVNRTGRRKYEVRAALRPHRLLIGRRRARPGDDDVGGVSRFLRFVADLGQRRVGGAGCCLPASPSASWLPIS